MASDKGYDDLFKRRTVIGTVQHTLQTKWKNSSFVIAVENDPLVFSDLHPYCQSNIVCQCPFKTNDCAWLREDCSHGYKKTMLTVVERKQDANSSLLCQTHPSYRFPGVI